MTETKISNFYKSFYISEIQKLVFHLPHVKIIGKNHCGDSRWTAFKRRKQFQDVICCRDYADRIVASFPHKLQS